MFKYLTALLAIVVLAVFVVPIKASALTVDGNTCAGVETKIIICSESSDSPSSSNSAGIQPTSKTDNSDNQNGTKVEVVDISSENSSASVQEVWFDPATWSLAKFARVAILGLALTVLGILVISVELIIVQARMAKLLRLQREQLENDKLARLPGQIDRI